MYIPPVCTQSDHYLWWDKSLLVVTRDRHRKGACKKSTQFSGGSPLVQESQFSLVEIIWKELKSQAVDTNCGMGYDPSAFSVLLFPLN